MNIDFYGHGYREAEADPKQKGALPGTPRDGAIVSNAPGD